MDAPLKTIREYRKLVDSTHTSRIVASLQRVAEGDAASAVADDLLVVLTGRRDAAQIMSDRQLRRLRNVLSHHSNAFKALAETVRQAFITEVEAEGLTLALE